MLRISSLALAPAWQWAGCLLLAVLGRGALAEAPKDAPKQAQAAQTDEVVVAEGEGIELTVADIEAELAHQPARLRHLREHPDALREVAERMLQAELLAQEAERRGYGKHPAVVQAAKEEAVQQLQRTLIDDEVTPASVPKAEVKAYYEEHGEQFHRPAMRRARHILLEKQSEAKALLSQARAADEREFQRLAREHSIDTETKQRGGDLRFFTLEGDPERREAPVHPALRKAAFALDELGDTVEKPVEVDGHYSIVRLTGIRKARDTSLERAEPQIRARLWRIKRRDALSSLLRRLQAKYKPQVFENRVDDIDLSDVGTRPTGFAPDPPTQAAKKKAAKKSSREKAPAQEP